MKRIYLYSLLMYSSLHPTDPTSSTQITHHALLCGTWNRRSGGAHVQVFAINRVRSIVHYPVTRQGEDVDVERVLTIFFTVVGCKVRYGDHDEGHTSEVRPMYG